MQREHKKRLFALVGATVISVIGIITPARSQIDGQSRLRAHNMARNTAITINGGISKYVPDSCMFNPSTPFGVCLVVNDVNGFTYRFLGGSPGWQVLGQNPSVETVIQIAPDGRSVLSIIYNGPPRVN